MWLLRDCEARQSGAESRTKELLSLMTTWRKKIAREIEENSVVAEGKKVFQKGNKSAVCCKKGQTRRGVTVCHESHWWLDKSCLRHKYIWNESRTQEMEANRLLKALWIRFWSGGLWMTAEGKWGCFSYFIMRN